MDVLVLERLVPACADLNANIKNVRSILERELGWVILPPLLRPLGESAVISSLCDIDIKDGLGEIYYGIAHIPEEYEKDITSLNSAKVEFKKAILDIRDKQRKRERNIALSKLLCGDDRPYCRDPKVQEALKKVGFASLDLASCYKEIRIIPPYFDMIGWTWQRKRREIFSTDKDGADKYARRWLTGDALEITLKQISALPDNERFARVRTQMIPQLKANYGFFIDEECTERGTEMLSASNVFLTTRVDMPRTAFQERPDGVDEDRKIRKDTKIHDEPIIPAINLHRYLTSEEIAARKGGKNVR